MFVIKIEDITVFDEKVTEMQKQLKQQKMEIYPFIIVVGDHYNNISEYYVSFDNTKFKFISFISCVDTCFKIYQVFHLEYPSQCYGVWLFFQRYFFNFCSLYDRNVSKVLGLISYLKKTN